VGVGRCTPADPIARCGQARDSQSGGCGDNGRWTPLDGVDDLGAVDALEVDAGDPEVGMPELPLDDDERDAFVGHLDRMCVTQLVWGESPPDARGRSGVMELLSSGGRLPVPPGCRAVDDAQERSDRQLVPGLQPRLKLAPGPPVHANLTSLAALATTDEDRAANSIEVALLKSEGLADRSPARHRSTISARSRWPSARSPTMRSTSTISSTVGGSAG
jgi:hypothetical protein